MQFPYIMKTAAERAAYGAISKLLWALRSPYEAEMHTLRHNLGLWPADPIGSPRYAAKKAADAAACRRLVELEQLHRGWLIEELYPR